MLESGFWERRMAQEHRSGQIVPESGVYRVTHASAHAGVLLQVRLIKGRRFPACPYCQQISFELAHSDEAFWRDRSAPGTRYRRHRRSARSQSSNKAVAGCRRAVFRFVGSARRSAILAAIVVVVRALRLYDLGAFFFSKIGRGHRPEYGNLPRQSGVGAAA
jgi:hypothetical protein